MPTITYVATRSLGAGTTLNDERQIECEFQARPRRSEFDGARRVSMDGTPESYLHSIIRRHDVTSDLVIKSTQLGQWREFLDSVMNAETFQLDLTGTIASPGTLLNVFLESTSLTEQEIGGLFVQFAFTVRELP